MANTTNFGWETPDDTDLVKDGASAMRTLGNSIDTSMVDLKGGTTGQILSKTSNTDMDFTWITSSGDIEGVTAGTGISGGGTSGTVTITNSMATAIDAKGDLIVGTGADTFSRLAVGTNNYVLTADSAEATGMKWAAAAGGGKVLQVVQGTTTTSTNIASTTFTDTTLSASITPIATTSKVLIMYTQALTIGRQSGAYSNGAGIQIVRGSTAVFIPASAYEAGYISDFSNSEGTKLRVISSGSYLDSPATTSSTTYKTQVRSGFTANSASVTVQESGVTSSIILMEIGA